MAAYTVIQRLTPTLALVAAGALGVLVALGVLLLPGSMLEDAVTASGIAAFIPAAEPPLGATARIVVAVFASGVAASVAWLALSALIGIARSRLPDADTRGPTVRRADAHPDAPPREPLRAGRDLGFELADEASFAPPPLDIPELPPEPVIAMGAPAPPESAGPPPVQLLPCDLDQPLAAFDPAAIPDSPLVPPPPVAPLHRQPSRPPLYEQGERFETFELTPPLRSVPQPGGIAAPETAATVHALLDRLERGIARRTVPATVPEPTPLAPQGLEDTLAVLRKMAARA